MRAVHVPSSHAGRYIGQLGIGMGATRGQSPSLHALHLPLRTRFAAATYAGADDAAIAVDPQSLPHATPWTVTQSESATHAREATFDAASSWSCAAERIPLHAATEIWAVAARDSGNVSPIGAA